MQQQTDTDTDKVRIRDAFLHREFSLIRRHWFALALTPAISLFFWMLGTIGSSDRTTQTNLELWLDFASGFWTPWLAIAVGFGIAAIVLIDTLRSLQLASNQVVGRLSNEIHQLKVEARHLSKVIAQKDQVIVDQTELARMDITTRIPNEVALHSEKETQIRAGVVLIMIDLVDFKKFNDDLGHSLGDKVLRMIAQFLFFGSRRTEKVYRLDHPNQSLKLPNGGSAYRLHRAGDEFLVVLEGGEEDGIAFLHYRLKNFLSANDSNVTTVADREIRFCAGVFAVETELTPDECLVYVDRCLSAARQKPLQQRLRWHSGQTWQSLVQKDGESNQSFLKRQGVYNAV